MAGERKAQSLESSSRTSRATPTTPRANRPTRTSARSTCHGQHFGALPALSRMRSTDALDAERLERWSNEDGGIPLLGGACRRPRNHQAMPAVRRTRHAHGPASERTPTVSVRTLRPDLRASERLSAIACECRDVGVQHFNLHGTDVNHLLAEARRQHSLS
jgi:hypothetical protein